MQKRIEEFKAYLHKMHAYEHAMGVMNYDFETAMPKGAAEDLPRPWAYWARNTTACRPPPNSRA